MCDLYELYRIIIFIFIIISLGQIIVSYGKHITHARTHLRTGKHPPTVAVQVVAVRWMGGCAPNHDEVDAPFSPIPLANNGGSVLHSNKQTGMRCGIRDSFGCFSRIKNC